MISMRSKIQRKPVKNPYQKFSEYKNAHKNETIIVCGCGHSLKTLEHPERTITIGVNDVGRQFTPDYLVVLNPKNQFKGDRFKYVENSTSKALFTQLNLKTEHKNTVKFKLGKRGGTNFDDSISLPYTRNSPYVALCLAIHMGASRIGLIGVDFTQDHFFSKTGKHSLSASLKSIDQEYRKLFKAAKERGVDIVNLSNESKVTAFPKESFEEFYVNSDSHTTLSSSENITEQDDVTPSRLGEASLRDENPKEMTLNQVKEVKIKQQKNNPKEKPLKIVSYSTTPVAGVPEILSNCINRYTNNECRCVWATNSYGNGVTFQSDIEWKVQPKLAMQVLNDADLVIVHNGKVAVQHQALFRRKPVITMAHNYIWNVDQSFVKRGYPGVVVAQYQATLPEFKCWTPIPNPMILNGILSGFGTEGLDEIPHSSVVATRSLALKNDRISICYTPSGKHDLYPKNHRLYWHSKGYTTTMAILDKLASQYPIKLEVIRDKQLPHSAVLAMKERSHIVIDECVTGSYHRNSLEGLESGCVVINGMGILKGLGPIFENCAGATSPFIGCGLDKLEAVLVGLIDRGKEALIEDGEKNRDWIEHHWRFSDQWERLWMPVIEKSMIVNRASNKNRTLNKNCSSNKDGAERRRDKDKRLEKDQRSKENNLFETNLVEANSIEMKQGKKAASEVGANIKPHKVTVRPENLTKSKHIKAKRGDIPVYWTCRQSRRGNFGDMLSPVLTKSLSGKNSVFRNTGSRLFAVGSLLKFANRGDCVWGTGFISATDKCKRGLDIRAVRGPLTRDIIRKQGFDCPEVYGDPGLLLPALYPQLKQEIKPNLERKQKGIGIIPHYVDYERVRSQLAHKGFRVIDIRAGIDYVIKAATQCEVLLCSSLHGCILGESFGIPTAWVELSDKVVGKGFKFRDYYASTDRATECVDWRKGIDIDTAVNMALDISPPKIDLQPLLDAFPYPNESSAIIRSRLGNVFVSPSDGNKQDNDNIRNVSANRPCSMTRIEIEASGKQEKTIKELGHSPSPVVSAGPSELQAIKSESKVIKQDSNTKQKIAVFGAITENYTEYMIASLRSFLRHNQDSDAEYDGFILGHSFSPRTQRLISSFGIGYININLNKEFKRNALHRYPGECFWIFKGPELFADRGYQYSLAVDGDTLCNKPLDISWLPQLKHIAGVNRGCGVGQFLSNLKQLDTLKRSFSLNAKTLDRPATNSGVLFFNNTELVKEQFFDRMVKTYQRSERLGVLRGGDDSTLALFLASHPNIDLHILEDSWNVYRGISSAVDADVLESLSTDSYIIHLSSVKPWCHHSQYPNSLVKNAIEQWRVLWPNSKNQRRMRSIERAKERMLTASKKIRSKTLSNPLPKSISKPLSKPLDSRNVKQKAKDALKQSRVENRSQAKNRGTSQSIKQAANSGFGSGLGLDLYWYRGKTLNMGDEIAPYLLRKILAERLGISEHQIPYKPVKDPSKTSNLSLLSVGSIMRLSGNNTVVWGSGIRNIDQPVNKAAKFCAVRGPLTRRRLLELGYSCPEVYGDPAVLLPKYYAPKVAKRYTLGIIPHLVDYAEIKQQYANQKNILVIDLNTADIESVIRQILSCEDSASSSLHGLILSVAYAIPTKWIKCAGNIMGDDTKFYDYFASLNPKVYEALNLDSVTIPYLTTGQSDAFECYRPLILTAPYPSIQKIKASTWRHNQTIDLIKLENAFPVEFFQRLVMVG